MMGSELFYKRAFKAAAYNIFWGIFTILFPNLLFEWCELPPLNYPFLMRGIGMFVGVYGYGYWVVARNIYSYPQLVIIGLIGKVLGLVGWAYHVYNNSIPLKTMWANVFNDLIWIPFFIAYLIWYYNAKPFRSNVLI